MMMLFTRERDRSYPFTHRKTLGIVVNLDTGICVSATQALNHLKGMTIASCMFWGFAHADSIQLKYFLNTEEGKWK